MLSKYISLLLVILLSFAVQATAEHKPVFTTDWFSQNLKYFDNYKTELKNKPNIHCLEIGSWEGRSSLYIVQNYCNGVGSQLDCVDTWNGSVEHDATSVQNLYQRFLHNVAPYIKSKKILPHKGNSKDVLVDLLQKVKKREIPQYDLIYIDGSHMAKDVLVDAVLAWELLNKGGIMIFDDYLWGDHSYSSPKPAIDGFLASYQSMYEIIHSGYQLHIRKIRNTPDIVGVDQN